MAIYKAVVSKKRIDTTQIKRIVCKGDLIDQVVFIIPRYEGSTDMSVYDHYLTFENVNGEGAPELLIPTVNTNTIELMWTISTNFTAVSGVVDIQLFAQDIVDEVVVMKWQTFPARIEVVSNVNPSTPYTLSELTILDEYLAYYQNVQPNITPNTNTNITGIIKGVGGKASQAVPGVDYQPALTFDSTPTDGSTNPVTSSGVYDALHPTYELIEKIIVGYSLTTSQPADWLTNWTSYYTNTGTAVSPVYTAVGGASAPTWAENTYYSYSVGGVAAIDRTAEPTGTPYDFYDVKIKAKTLPNSAGTASLFSRAYVSDTNFIEGYTSNGVSTTLTWYYYHRFFVDGGYWNGFFSTNTSAYSGYPTVGVYASFDKQNAYSIAAYPTIKRIKLSTYPGTINMLGGCEYEIWGMRA